MPKTESFNQRSAARTRAAVHILETPELLEHFLEHGGTPDDLRLIRDHGRNAEALSIARAAAGSAGETDTLAVQTAFAALQGDYSEIMSIATAVRAEAARPPGSPQLVVALEKILANEAAVIRVSDGEGPDAKKKAKRSVSQEAVRQEIYRDAVALSNLTAAHPLFARRRVEPARFEALAKAAEALSGKLSSRTASKGASKAATAAIHEEVSQQKVAWLACRRILALVAEDDERVRSLLREAAT